MIISNKFIANKLLKSKFMLVNYKANKYQHYDAKNLKIATVFAPLLDITFRITIS